MSIRCILLTLDAEEASALKDAAMELLQDDAEKLDSREWLAQDQERAAFVAVRFAALTRLLGKLAPA